MLKLRIIPVQLLLGGRLVKTLQFGKYRDVGDPVASSRVYNSQYADELIFLNIDRNSESIEPLKTILSSVSKVCFMPLSVGGGIRNYEDGTTLLSMGADKVVLNTICYRKPEVISYLANRHGSQAVTVAIDVRNINGSYHLFSNCGKTRLNVSIEEHCNKCIDSGAGEILIQSIDHDGSMQGYDLKLLKLIKDFVDIPIIALGGAGDYMHLKDAFVETKISAVACGSLFNFSDSNPIRAKAFLNNYDLNFKVV